jgi:hypothetical protein
MEKEQEKEETNLEELPEQNAEIIPADEVDEFQDLLPKMNVGISNNMQQGDVSNLIGDEELISDYNEIMNMIRDDRKQVSEFIDNMADMVINEGDATSSSKEALVNLVKMKTDLADKMVKIADLKTRIKLKERDTFPRYLAANQNNTINIGESSSRRALIEAVNKAKKKG